MYSFVTYVFVFSKIGTYVEKMFQSELSGNVIGMYLYTVKCKYFSANLDGGKSVMNLTNVD